MFGTNAAKSRTRASLMAMGLLGTATGLAGPALAGTVRDDAPAPQMVLGAAALPPVGFLNLCERAPQECADASGNVADVATLRAKAMRGFWASAFSDPAFVSNASSAPAAAAGDAASALRVSSAPAARAGFGRTVRYDWSRVFSAGADPWALSVAAEPARPSPVEAGPPVADGGAETSAVALAGADALSPETLGQLVVEADAAAVAWDAVQVAGEPIAAFASAAVIAVTPVPEIAPTLPVSGAETAGVVASASAGAGAGAGSGSGSGSKAGAEPGPHQPEVPAAAFSLDGSGWRLVNGINRRVNRQIRHTDDIRTFGVRDFWIVPRGDGARGDCEDFVLAKRRALIEAGVPAAVLSIAIVETRWGVSHAVLLIAAEQGEFVLDSLTPWVTRWDKVNYVWRERQLPGRPFDWVRAAI